MMDFQNSIDAFNEAKMVIPGGVDSPVRAFKGVKGSPIFIDRGEGAYMYDIDGNRYIDYVQSWGPLIFGHADEETINAVVEIAKKGLSFGAPTSNETLLAKEIALLYDGVEKLRFVNSGTEATMSAIRLARGYSGKDGILKFEGCYHGHSDALLVKAGSGAATFGAPSSLGVPTDFSKHTYVAEYNSIDSVEAIVKNNKNIACVIIEPIAGNMGLVPAKIEFLKYLREMFDKEDIVLIFDEVMSGFRTSLSGSQGINNIVPDMATFGKVIGGGMPVGAFGGKCEIMDLLSPDGAVYQAGTLSGNPIAISAGFSMITRLKKDKNLYKELNKKAKRLTEGLKEAASEKNISIQVNSVGSMFGFFFNENEVNNFSDASRSDLEFFAEFHRGMLERGVYFACSQFEAGFISTKISDEDIENTIKAAKETFLDLTLYR